MQLPTNLWIFLLLGAFAILLAPPASAQQYPPGGQDTLPPDPSPPPPPPGYATSPGNYQTPGYYPPQGQPGYPPQQTYYPQPGYAPPGSAGMPGGYPNQPAVAPVKASPQDMAKVGQWFQKYDEVRRKAQMNPNEKQQADGILGKGLSILWPGQDKIAAREIMSKLVTRYDIAVKSLESLQSTPETKRLHQGYYQYFATARGLFSDYLKVQDNLMAKDNNGQPIMSQLMQRKVALESLEHACKELDATTRAQYGIPAYRY